MLNKQNQLSFDDEDKPMYALYLLMSRGFDQVFTEFLRFARIEWVAAVNNT